MAFTNPPMDMDRWIEKRTAQRNQRRMRHTRQLVRQRHSQGTSHEHTEKAIGP